MISPGDEVDRMRLGEVIEAAAQQLVAADPDPKKHRIDIYRQVVIDGRTMFVRVKFTIPFVGAPV